MSIKNAIDLSENGIMLFKNNKRLVTNNKMNEILEDLKINDNYLINILKHVNKYNILKSIDKAWQVEYSNTEIILYDITDIYNLQMETLKQNKKIEANNKKISETLNILEELEKSEQLIKIKNEFHDLLGSRLSLFSTLLDKNEINPSDARYVINNLFVSDNDKKACDLLNNLVLMHKVLGINIIVSGLLPNNDNVAKIFFEVIREAVTNAIRHANCKNVYIDISNKRLVIQNDGIKLKSNFVEHEGIKGIKRKVNDLNGSVDIRPLDNFKIIITLN